MNARRSFSNMNLLSLGSLMLVCALATPILADTTAPQYDPNGNLTSRTTSLGTTDYTYDALDRLRTEFGPGVDQSFGYDGNGNRQSDATNVYTVAPNGNRIQSVNGITQVYDPAGNLLDDGQGRTFAYNAAGRLREARVNNVLVASYKYNYQGLRTHKIAPQGTTLYHYDTQGHLIQTTDPLGTPKQSLHWADDQPIAQVDHAPGGDKLVYLHTDQLNTPRYATDANQAVVWRWEGEAFGKTVPNQDPDGDGTLTTVNMRYAGQYYDSETGLHYNWNRYYDPKIGRYITSDPIGLEGGLNTYRYAENNPLRYTDPDGLKTMQCTKPLNALGPKYGPLGYKYGPLLYHQYSCVVDKNGKVTCGGQDRGENGEGKPSNDVLDPPGGQCEQTQPDNDCFEQCLISEWAKPRPKYGIPLGTDCQEYDDDVNTRCRKQCKIQK